MNDELLAILNTIEGMDAKVTPSITQLIEYGFKLSQWIARSGQLQAEAKILLHSNRRQAMVNLVATLSANGAAMPVSLQKDYVNDLCGIQNGDYELACRTNSACIHALDFVRSCISALKFELQNSQGV